MKGRQATSTGAAEAARARPAAHATDAAAAPAADAALIEAILAGDEAAFRTVYRAHAGTLYRVALRLAGGRTAAAEDAVQECWSRALRLLPSFEQRSSLGRWLRGIVVRCSLERIRADLRVEEALPDHTTAAARADRPDERLDLQRLFEALPAGYRAVLVLHDIEGCTHADIAALLAISPGTSKSQLARARTWLRRGLGHDYLVE